MYETYPLLSQQLIMLYSTCSELHHGYSRFPYCGATDDMGLLRYIFTPLRCPNYELIHDRLFQQSWKQPRCESHDDHSRNSKCRPKLIFLLPTSHCMHGLWRGQTQSRQNNVVRSNTCFVPLCLRSHIRRGQLNYHTRQCRTARPARHLTSSSNIDRILCVDTELSEPYDERPFRKKTKR